VDRDRTDQFNVPFQFTSNLSRGVGEQGVYGGMMLGDQIVEWKRIGNLVQLIAKNYSFTGGTNAPIVQGVKEGFTDSLLGAATVQSLPHPERQSVLVDANALLLTDIPVGERFTAGIHMRSYTFDAKNSSFEAIRNSPDQSSFVVSAHYQNGRATLPPASALAAAANPYPPFTTLPDARSLFLGYTYNFAKLPTPMVPRRADPRIGHFETSVWDFSSDSKYSARTHYVDRWRSRRRIRRRRCRSPGSRSFSTSTATSREVPAYGARGDPRVEQGVREDRLQGRDRRQAAGRGRDGRHLRRPALDGALVRLDRRRLRDRTLHRRLAHRRDPQCAGRDSGGVVARSPHVRRRAGAVPVAFARAARQHRRAGAYPMALRDGNLCTFAADALAEMQFGLDVLEERGEIQAGSPEAEAFVNASLKSAVMHEVGHALGLRHNFRASTVYPLAKLSDPAWSRERGLAGSVMDYSPINIAANGEGQGAYFESTIGPYDYWAIEYAYRDLPKETESDELEKIAGRGATDPLLAFSSDEEVIAGLDPDASRFDLGSDPLVYLQKRLLISQELWQRLQTKKLKPGESYAVLRRTFDAGFRQFARSAALIAKYVGGIYYVRDYAGTSQLPLTPVPPAKQREALNIVATGIFSADSFKFKPEFLRSMGIDYLEVGLSSTSRMNPDFSLRTRVLSLQVGMMNTMLSDAVLARIQESEEKVGAGGALTLHELFATVRASIWSELAAGGSISAPRRDLQREHVRRIASVLLRPSSTPADAVALFREEAKTLSKEIKAAAGTGGRVGNVGGNLGGNRSASRDAQTRAHLSESAGILDEALKAPLVRQGV
jgi:hypothetical protein